jgi:acylpyruvate hydrolase
MKIICIGRNYIDHAKELNHEVPTEPVFFIKPETAIPIGKLPFFYPDFSMEIHYEAELVLRVCRLGKNISEKFAMSYIDAISVGIDFTARDIQRKLSEKGLPWEAAKAFDGSAPVGHFKLFEDMELEKGINFHFELNGKTVQKANSKEMIFSFEQIIAHVSKYVTLKQGDYIFTGTPAGVGPVNIGDKLTAFLEGDKVLQVSVK